MSLLFFYLMMGFTPCIILGNTKTNIKHQQQHQQHPPLFYMDADILSPFSSNNLEVETRRKNRLSHKFYEVNKPPKTTIEKNSEYSIHSFTKEIGKNTIFGHRIIIWNGKEMLSVLEPSETNGCDKHKRATVKESSKQRECVVAVSGGFFNGRTGQCFGNLVSDGEDMNRFRGLKSANFGILQDGSLVVGYLKETDIMDMRTPFQQLISGVGWVLRNGASYLNESLLHEQCNIDNLQNFFDTKSSRTLIGHDNEGRIQIIQVDGRTGDRGISLYEAVELLLWFGLENAVNLNGGGASTLVVNDTVINYPSNICTSASEEPQLCAMKVSSILCVHQPDKCVTGKTCGTNGHCYKDKCKCQVGWTGKKCHISTDDHLAACCWRNYYLVVVLSTLAAVTVIINIILCDMFMLYRFRANDLSAPKHSGRQKDKLRTYLKENSILMSSNEDMLSSPNPSF